jgi:hypothetical protein
MSVQLPTLNFPTSTFNLKEVDGRLSIFDQSRRKFVNLTPEEWVRQNCLVFLRENKGYPMSLLAVEKSFKLNGKLLRYDIVAYSKAANPILLVECKAPEIKISQKTFDQIVVYNMELKVPYLMVTNGLDHYCCVVDAENSRFQFLKEIPDFSNV